jgi:cell division control protein 6
MEEQIYLSKSISNQNIFFQYTKNETVFKDKRVLTSSYFPEKIKHREKEIQTISSILAPVIKGYKPNNLFVYGTVGTGKTVTVKFVINQLNDISKDMSKKQVNIKTIYINCKMKKVSDTEYRMLAQLLTDLGIEVPNTGLPTDHLYRKFFEKIDEKKQAIIITLDEIDVILKKIGDGFLYNLTRANSELKNSTISIIGITNNLSFKDTLDMRVKSSLGEEEIIFRPYDAVQMKDILTERSVNCFRDGVLGENVINKCAALAAQEHGDARRALDILRVAGEIADRNGDNIITEEHVDKAQEKIDVDRVLETIKSQPKHSQAVLYSIIKINKNNKNDKKWADKRILTGDIYDNYSEICTNTNLKPLTQRRVSDLIGEFDMLGIITARVVSKGRYGRTREINIALNENMIRKAENILSERFPW